MGVGACVSIQFGVLETVKRFFMVIFFDSLKFIILQSLQPPGKKELDLSYIFVAGMVAGLANAIVSIPAEHIRIRIQVFIIF